MKIRALGAELLHADGHDEAKSRFSQSCEPGLSLKTLYCPTDAQIYNS